MIYISLPLQKEVMPSADPLKIPLEGNETLIMISILEQIVELRDISEYIPVIDPSSDLKDDVSGLKAVLDQIVNDTCDWVCTLYSICYINHTYLILLVLLFPPITFMLYLYAPLQMDSVLVDGFDCTSNAFYSLKTKLNFYNQLDSTEAVLEKYLKNNNCCYE